MIVLYDEITGRVTQTFLFVSPSNEEYAETVLKPAGAKYLFHGGENIASSYVVPCPICGNPEVTPRPIVKVTGDIRQITADGNDTLSLTIDQPAKVKIIANRQVVATETIDDGSIGLAFNQPGIYTVMIGVDTFPIIETVLTIEAV